MQENVEQLLDHYLKDVNLELPRNSKFRQWVGLLDDESFYVCHHKISNKHQLKKFIKKCFKKGRYLKKVYYTNTFWLSPHLLRGQIITSPGWKWLSNIFLGGDVLFDFDKRSYGFDQVQKDFLITKDYMNEYTYYKYLGSHFSGSHGLHAWWEDYQKYDQPNPFIRQGMYKLRRLLLNMNLPNLPTLDGNHITDNPRQIYKANRLFDMSTGKIVDYVNLDLTTDFERIVKKLPYAPVSPDSHQGNDTSHLQNTGENDCPGEKSLPTYYYVKGVKNNIWGVKGQYVPLFFFPKNRYKKNQVEKTQKLYSLGPLFVFETEGTIAVLGLKPYALPRLVKIMKHAKSMYTTSFIKYKHLYLSLSGGLSPEGKIVSQPTRLVDTLPFLIPKRISKPHYELISRYTSLQTNTQMIGAHTYKIKFQKVNLEKTLHD